MNLIKLIPSKIEKTLLKIGFNHTCDESLNPLLVTLKPQVIRTYFNKDDVSRSYKIGAEPFVGVRFMPPELGLNGNRESLPKDYSLWGEYVEETVSGFLRDGFRPKYYSIWNEPERRENPIFWEGGIEDYITLFKYSSNALKKVDPTCLVGGPETTSYNLEWICKLMAESVKENFDLDFLSFHQFEDPSTIIGDANKARNDFKSIKGYEPEIHIGEWGFKVKNAFLAHQHLADAEQARIGFYCKDFFFERKWKCSVIDDEYNKRDMFYLLKEYSKFGKERVGFSSDNELVKIIANPVNNGIQMLISCRMETQRKMGFLLQTSGGAPINVDSVKEITNNGLIFQDNQGTSLGELNLESQKVYLVNGRYKVDL